MTAEETPNVWKEVTYTLKFPVSLGNGTSVTSITFREPNGEALEAIDALGMEPGSNPTTSQGLGVIRALSGTQKEVTNKLHIKDIAGMMEVITPLLEGVL